MIILEKKDVITKTTKRIYTELSTCITMEKYAYLQSSLFLGMNKECNTMMFSKNTTMTNIWFRIKIGDFDSCNQVGSNHLINYYIVQMSKMIIQKF
jgi:hypothetical protein